MPTPERENSSTQGDYEASRETLGPGAARIIASKDAEIDRLLAALAAAEERADMWQATAKTLATKVVKSEAEVEALREAGEGLWRAFCNDPPPGTLLALARWKEVAGDLHQPTEG